jgi:protein-L-isoaspartate O-methyltransferase
MTTLDTIRQTTLAARRRLTDELVDGGAAGHTWVRDAFAAVPREVFVPRFYRRDGALVDGAAAGQRDEWLAGVYRDQTLVVQHTGAGDVVGAGLPTSSSSQPSVMAGMLTALDLQPHHRVLEIGTGTGYNTALLCQRVGAERVTSIELHPGLAASARAALAQLGLHPTLLTGDGATPPPSPHRFDRVLATAACNHIPPAWIDQLAPDGGIVTDLRGSLGGGIVRLAADPGATVTEGEPVDTVHGQFLALPGAFMPMRTRVERAYHDGHDWDQVVYDHRNPQQRTTDIDPALATAEPGLRLLIQLQLAGHPVRLTRQNDPAALSARGIDGSWATASLTTGRDGLRPIQQAGPGRLWDSIEAAYRVWEHLDRPPLTRYHVTAAADPVSQHVQFPTAAAGCYSWPLPL